MERSIIPDDELVDPTNLGDIAPRRWQVWYTAHFANGEERNYLIGQYFRRWVAEHFLHGEGHRTLVENPDGIEKD